MTHTGIKEGAVHCCDVYSSVCVAHDNAGFYNAALYIEKLKYDRRINRFYFCVLAAETISLTKGPQRTSDDYCCNQANAGSPLLLPTQTQRLSHPQLDFLARLLQTVIQFTW